MDKDDATAITVAVVTRDEFVATAMDALRMASPQTQAWWAAPCDNPACAHDHTRF